MWGPEITTIYNLVGSVSKTYFIPAGLNPYVKLKTCGAQKPPIQTVGCLSWSSWGRRVGATENGLQQANKLPPREMSLDCLSQAQTPGSDWLHCLVTAQLPKLGC